MPAGRDREPDDLHDVEPDDLHDVEPCNMVMKRAPYKREKKICPVKNCGASVISLPRHLQLHGWSRERAAAATQQFNLRKEYNRPKPDAPKYTDYHKPRKCPVAGCLAIVKRLPPHLQHFHGIVDKKRRQELQALARKQVRDLRWLGDSECQPTDASSDESSSLDRVDYDCDQRMNTLVDSNAQYDEWVCTDNINDTTNYLDVNLFDKHSENEFKKFEQWLLSADGGAKSDKSTKQHVFQVRTIVSVIDEHQHRPSKLLDVKALRDTFLKSYVESKQFLPGTTKAYLNSLIHWFRYMLSENSSQLSQRTRTDIQTMNDRLRRWISSLRGLSLKRHLQKQDDDFTNLITSDQVQEFNSSACAKDAVKLLGNAALQKPSTISEHDYVLVRDFLLCKIVLNNANRSGVLSNMTMAQFQQSKVIDGHHVISVTDHKTASNHGPAKIVLTSILFGWLSLFTSDIRPLVLEREQTNVFLSSRGEPLTSGQVSKAIQSVWMKSGLSSQINCTLIRKSAVSAVHRLVPDCRSNLADLMGHRLETATKSYRLADRNFTTVSASQTLCRVMEGALQSDANKGDKQITASTVSSVLRDMDVDTSNDRVSRMLETMSQYSDSEGIVPPSGASANKQRIFSDDELDLISTVCKPVIMNGPISHKRLTEYLRETIAGRQLLDKFTIAQIISRVKYERRIMRK